MTRTVMTRQTRGDPGKDWVLEVSSIAKSYGATCALRNASLRLRPGKVHALLGENGAGKSTLVKIVVGAIQPDRGRIALNGVPTRFAGVRQAIAAGVIPIYQHLSLFPHLSVLENLSAFAIAGAAGLRARPALVPRATARAWLDAVGLGCDLDLPVERLSVGERQLVEIVRGLGQRCKLLVLDEPTAALTHDETDRLFGVVRRLCAEGTAVLFISHKFDEIEALADDVTVLRDGVAVIDAEPLASLSRAELVRAMLGDMVESGDRALPQPGGPVLTATGLRLGPADAPADITVRAGEIVGLAGLVGSGTLELAAALAGARPVAAGTLAVRGEALPPGDRARAVAAGVGYVPADRHAEGLFGPLAALQNASSSTVALFSRGGLLRPGGEAAALIPWLRRLNLHPFQPERPAAGFSGGNQQKLLLSRNLAVPDLRVLVVLEPTRGVDIAARETIHDALVEAAGRGVAVVVASSDLDEVMALSHRILVVRHGSLDGELPRGTGRTALMDRLAGRRAA